MRNFLRTAIASAAMTIYMSLSAGSLFTCTEVTSYQPQSCNLVLSQSAACNKGDEPFSSFIKKWETDESFRKSRLTCSGNTPEFLGDTDEERKENMLGQLAYVEDYIGGYPVRPAKKHRAYGCTRFATYFAVTADTVGFHYESECGEEGGSTAILGFERINGKWYLSCLALAG